MTVDEHILEAAIAWSVRTSDPAFDDWEAFTQWLELSPVHAAAYDHVMVAVADGAAAIDDAQVSEAPAEAANDPSPPAARHRWFGAAIAACLVVFLALGIWRFDGSGEIYATGPGETLAIDLADGSRVDLAGGSRIAITGDRAARLETGRALFTVVHDSSDPFVVRVADQTLVDAGTIFDVNLRSSDVDVAVSEGLVIYDPDRRRVRIEPGEILTFTTDGSGRYALAEMPLDQVGEWTSGRITFRSQRLEDVATDLSRASGIAFEVAPDSGSYLVSGSVAVPPIRAAPTEIGPLLGVEVSQQNGTWVLVAPR